MREPERRDIPERGPKPGLQPGQDGRPSGRRAAIIIIALAAIAIAIVLLVWVLPFVTSRMGEPEVTISPESEAPPAPGSAIDEGAEALP